MGSHLLEGVTPWGVAGGRTVFNGEGQVPKLKERFPPSHTCQPPPLPSPLVPKSQPPATFYNPRFI